MHMHKHVKLPFNLIIESSLAYPTFHFFFQGETAMDSLQFRLHRQPADVCLQVGSVHHAYPKDNESHVLRLRSHQAALSLRVSAIVLFILKHHPTSRFGWASNTCGNTKGVFEDTLQEILDIPDLKPRIMYHAHPADSLGKLRGPHLFHSNNTATEPNPRHNGDNEGCDFIIIHRHILMYII